MTSKDNSCTEIIKSLQTNRYCFVQLEEADEHLSKTIYKEGQQFSNSWNNLHIDGYMGDKGTYRYRRYSVINCTNGHQLEYLPPEPHFQSRTYNILNGDVYRHYSPFENHILKGSLLKDIICFSSTIFNGMKEKQKKWRVECHQFRIVSSSSEPGLPTPEGKHRDGVDFTFVMLVNRINLTGGETSIYDINDQKLTSHIMKKKWEGVFSDDVRTMHEVSPIYKSSPQDESYRDTLVLTFQAF